MAIVKLSASERRRVSAFFTCLVFAGFAWAFTTLSNKSRFTIREVLIYKNAPRNRAFHSLQPDTVNAVMQGTGWQMIFSGMTQADKVIPVNLRTLENRDYVVLSSQLKQINDKKEPDQQIISFYPDTLYFDFSDKAVKKVPIKLITGIKYQHQFSQSNNASLNPAYVTLNGPANALAKIKSWNTDSLMLDSVNETIKTNVNLQPASETNVNMYPRSVQVIVPVDEFTEKTISIPVKLINNKDYYHVKIFPQKVKVTFKTSLSRYAEMDDDFFEASADLSLWRDRGYSELPVKLTRFPPYCKIVKIEPQNIDFIIRK